jgi:hypothetical protein
MRFFTQFLVLNLPLQVNHVPFFCELVNGFFELNIRHLVDLAHGELVDLAHGASHFSLLVMLHGLIHFFFALLKFH